jgi:predicted RNase H-like nuclease (RuvC/YqgF family)
MHDIQALMDILGFDKAHQIRERLDMFKPVLGESLKRGSKNKVLVDNNGLAVLRRAKELEDSGYTLKDALNELKTELQSAEPMRPKQDPETDLNDLTKLLLQEKDKRLSQMEEEIQFLRNQVTSLETMIDNRLPELAPSRDEIEEKAKESKRWQRLKQLVSGK